MTQYLEALSGNVTPEMIAVRQGGTMILYIWFMDFVFGYCF